MKILFKKSILTTVSAAGLLAMVPLVAQAETFTPGNLVVERLGDGTQTLATTGNTMYMDEFTTGGTAVQSIQIDSSDSSALIDDGTATTGGAITLSPNGQLLSIPGYNTAQPYSASLSASPGTSVARAVGTVDANGRYQLQVITTTHYSTTTIRGATSDGNGNFWTSGGSTSGTGGGICYLGTNSPDALLTDGTFRQAYLFGTNLWFDAQNSSGAGGYNLGVYEFTGAPTTGPATPAQIFGLSGSSTYGLSVNNPNNPTVIYFADATLSGIHKWTNNGSGTWSQAYVINPSGNLFGLTVDWTTTPATIYATTTGANNKLIKIVDNGPTSVATTNAAAGANKIFRGVSFAPISIVAGNNNSGRNVNLTCSTVPGGVYSWTGPNGFSSSHQNPTVTNVTTASAGTYTVTVSWDGSLYKAAASTIVTIVYPDPTITTPGSVCPSSMANTASVPTAGVGASYLWTISGGTITAGAGTNAITFTANASGTITLGCAITNSLGNGVTGSATVGISAIPVTSASNNGPYCAGSTVQLFATGNASDNYSWTGPSGFTSSLQNPTIVNATPANSGVYSATRDTGCGMSLASQTPVNVNAIPNSTITAANSVCGSSTGNPASVPDAGNGAGYNWTISGGFFTGGANTNAILYTASASGTITLTCTVTNSSGCYSNASSATVTINPLPNAAINAAKLVAIKSASTASVAISPGASYYWTITGGTIIGSVTGNSIIFSVGGQATNVTLECSVTPNTGCSSSANVNIAVIQPFTRGNLAILRIGNGTELLNANGNSVFIDEYTTNGTRVQTVPLPDSGSNSIVEVPTSTVEGGLTLSADGTLLAFPGYQIALTNSSSSVAATPASTVPRAACTLDGAANFEIAVVTTDQYNADNLRCIATDGTNNFWTAGSADGTWYLSPQTESEIQINQAANTRQIYTFNGNLYIVTASSLSEWGAGVYEFNGLPTSLSIPTPLMLCTNATAPGVNPTGFSISPDGLSAYVADQVVGINKWTNSSGTWNPAYSFDPATTSADGLLVDWSRANPVIYGTTSNGGSGTGTNTLFSLVDTGMNSEPVTLAVAAANTLFRGVAFTPQPQLNQFQTAFDFGPGFSSGENLGFTNVSGSDFYIWSSVDTSISVTNWTFGGQLAELPLGTSGFSRYGINVNPGTTPVYYIFAQTNIGPFTATEPLVKLTGDIFDGFYISGMTNAIETNGEFIFSTAPQITIQPLSIAVLAGQNANFNVAANGYELSYQWFFNSNGIANATAPMLALSKVSSTNAGKYSVIITNTSGSVTSAVTTLTVAVPPALKLGTGTGGSFQISASSITDLTYVVLSTSNLASHVWLPVMTNNTGNDGVLNFQTNALGIGSHFYRLVFP